MEVETEVGEIDAGLKSLLFSEDNFLPPEPKSIRATGLSTSFIEVLICKHLDLDVAWLFHISLDVNASILERCRCFG